MPYFLSEKSIIEAHNELIANNFLSPGILHTFLILKAGGINSKSFEPISLINEKCYLPAYKLSSLFTPNEKSPGKYDFISPFSMNHWAQQAPSEALKKWVSSRIKNNILGGATTWRPIITDDINGEKIKFRHDYLNIISIYHLGAKKIPLGSIAIWANRFTIFDIKKTLRELIDIFINEFKLTNQEINSLFDYSSKISPTYSTALYQGSAIRELIGKPSEIQDEGWINAPPAPTESYQAFLQNNFKPRVLGNLTMNTELINSLLQDEKQVILSGPPGTSKSFYAQEIAEKYFKGNATKIQFHPKYTYQDFIGGYVVRGENVVFENGILVELLETKLQNGENHLLIIDEINRANVGQVFGETIQLLDRGNKIQIRLDGKLKEFSLPDNLYIIGTMNSSDRTLGAVDFAIRRRFSFAYCAPDIHIVAEKCESDFEVSLADLLKKLNLKLLEILKNPELAIGHTFFMSPKRMQGDKFLWELSEFCKLFNHKILPMIEEFCHGNQSQLFAILGDELPKRLQGEEFVSAIQKFINE